MMLRGLTVGLLLGIAVVSARPSKETECIAAVHSRSTRSAEPESSCLCTKDLDEIKRLIDCLAEFKTGHHLPHHGYPADRTQYEDIPGHPEASTTIPEQPGTYPDQPTTHDQTKPNPQLTPDTEILEQNGNVQSTSSNSNINQGVLGHNNNVTSTIIHVTNVQTTSPELTSNKNQYSQSPENDHPGDSGSNTPLPDYIVPPGPHGNYTPYMPEDYSSHPVYTPTGTPGQPPAEQAPPGQAPPGQAHPGPAPPGSDIIMEDIGQSNSVTFGNIIVGDVNSIKSQDIQGNGDVNPSISVIEESEQPSAYVPTGQTQPVPTLTNQENNQEIVENNLQVEVQVNETQPPQTADQQPHLPQKNNYNQSENNQPIIVNQPDTLTQQTIKDQGNQNLAPNNNDLHVLSGHFLMPVNETPFPPNDNIPSSTPIPYNPHSNTGQETEITVEQRKNYPFVEEIEFCGNGDIMNYFDMKQISGVPSSYGGFNSYQSSTKNVYDKDVTDLRSELKTQQITLDKIIASLKKCKCNCLE